MGEAHRILMSTKSRLLTVLLSNATLIKLEVELLGGCGMMPRSAQRSLVGREVPGSSSSSVAAEALESSLVASFPIEPPRILGAFSLASGWKTEFPLVNLFGGTLRLNERLGCHDPFMSGHASRLEGEIKK